MFSSANPLAYARYSGTCSSIGGTSPVTYSVSAGSLPTGLTLNPSTGVISGAPAASGVASFTIKVSDSGTQNASQAFTITVSLPPPFIITSSLAAANKATPFSGQFVAAGGNPPYTYSVTSGALPAGLTLNSSGLLSGTPTAQGTNSFTVTAVDSSLPALLASKPITLIVGPPQGGTVTVTATSGNLVTTTTINVTVP